MNYCDKCGKITEDLIPHNRGQIHLCHFCAKKWSRYYFKVVLPKQQQYAIGTKKGKEIWKKMFIEWTKGDKPIKVLFT